MFTFWFSSADLSVLQSYFSSRRFFNVSLFIVKQLLNYLPEFLAWVLLNFLNSNSIAEMNKRELLYLI
jgi:hypothetical protein